MSKEIYLKNLVESKFGNVRYFAEQIEIPIQLCVQYWSVAFSMPKREISLIYVKVWK